MKTLKTKNQFNEAKKYVKESKNHIYAAIAIFILAGTFGFVYRAQLGFIDAIIQELFMKTEGLNTLELAIFILQNNALSAFLAITLGIFIGVFPLFNTISNGVVIGYVLGIVKDTTGTTQFWRLIPHGIFELPAIFIALGLGIRLGLTIFHPKINRAKEFKNRVYQSANTFLMIIIPLLIIAAIIEGLLISFLG